MKRILSSIAGLGLFFLLTGFNLDNAVVPKKEILSGGPPKDGIPAILNPEFIGPEAADFLTAGDVIIGATLNGEAKTYPVKILNWHEVVNDTVGGVPIAVTF